MTTHTPGPWEVRHKRSIHPVGREFVAVAVAEQHDKNCEANAHLIAAAPDLLARAIDLLLAVDDNAVAGKDSGGNVVLRGSFLAVAERLRDAVTKATP